MLNRLGIALLRIGAGTGRERAAWTMEASLYWTIQRSLRQRSAILVGVTPLSAWLRIQPFTKRSLKRKGIDA